MARIARYDPRGERGRQEDRRRLVEYMKTCTICGEERFTPEALEDCTSESGQHSFEAEPSGVKESDKVVEGDPE